MVSLGLALGLDIGRNQDMYFTIKKDRLYRGETEALGRPSL